MTTKDISLEEHFFALNDSRLIWNSLPTTQEVLNLVKLCEPQSSLQESLISLPYWRVRKKAHFFDCENPQETNNKS